MELCVDSESFSLFSLPYYWFSLYFNESGFDLYILGTFFSALCIFVILNLYHFNLFFKIFGIFASIFLGGISNYYFQGDFSLYLMIILNLCLLLALFDSKFLAVPDWINVSLLIFVLCVKFLIFGLSFKDFFEGLGMAGLLGLFKVLGDIIYKKQILGEGDILFIASIGIFFGSIFVWFSFFWGCVFGSGYGLIGRVFGKKVAKIPLISFIFLGIIFYFWLGFLR